MEKTPKFIREFSKENSQKERQQATQAIKAKRAEYFDDKNTKTEKQNELQKTIEERESILNEKLEAIKKLKAEIEELSSNGFKKLLNYFELKKLQADSILGKKTYEELKQQQNIIITKKQEISGELRLKEETTPELKKAKEMLDDFYKNQIKKWEFSEYTKQDIEKDFSEENLISLSLEDYILLLKRFPSEMVTHVTRQGIRDHIGHMFHTTGEGEYSNNFMKMVEDGHLRSPLSISITENGKEKALERFLPLDYFKNKEEALEYFEQQYIEGDDYADRNAVHFATEEVADTYYGSEKGNEIFFAYPSAYIASQYYFRGQLNERSGGNHNDQWVWANEEKGIDLNTGLVFIPEEARVDEETGSRYKLDEHKCPIKNIEYKEVIKKIVSSLGFHKFVEEVREISGKLSWGWYIGELSTEDNELLQKLEPYRKKLENEFKITDLRLQNAIFEYHNLTSLDCYKTEEEKEGFSSGVSVDDVIENILGDAKVKFKEAENTISSKEFWESYFKKNPDKKPSKIVYYKGEDPTMAFIEWKEKNGLNKKSKDKNIGFPEKNISSMDERANVGRDRFKSIAEQAIVNFFLAKEKSSNKKHIPEVNLV